MKKWKFHKANESAMYVIWELDKNQNPIPYTGRSYFTKKDAMTQAKSLNKTGHHVSVYKELGFCYFE